MLMNLKSAIAAVVLGAFCTTGALAQEWKDRAEYDLVVESISKEQNPKTKLGLINQWKEKYPDTQFKTLRHNLYVTTYQQLGDGKAMKAASEDWLKDDPKAIPPYYWLNLLAISLNDTSADALAAGERAGKGLLSILDEAFDASKKPEAVSAADWAAQKVSMAGIANKTLGWVAMQRDQNEAAERYFVEALKHTPATAPSACGPAPSSPNRKRWRNNPPPSTTSSARRRRRARRPPRRPEETDHRLRREELRQLHGDKGGLAEIIAQAKTSPIPPAGFKIESKDEILIKQEEELKRTQPVLALWVSIKRELSGANGPTYWENFKGTMVPGGVLVGETNVEKFKGVVVSSSPERRPKEVVLGLSSPDMSEVTIRFDTPMPNPIDPGTELEFSGVPLEYTADPFMLVFDVEKEDVVGWPKPAPPAKKAPAKRKK